jgi:hypothetical protein
MTDDTTPTFDATYAQAEWDTDRARRAEASR